MSKVIDGLRTWVDLGLTDLRQLETEQRLPPPQELVAGQSIEEATGIIANVFGVNPGEAITIETAVCDVQVSHDKLEHIVEKRQDARERYANFALETLRDPFEIWKAMYDDDYERFLFIGTFATKRQMLVVVSIFPTGEILWNFMHCDAKSLNKHRHGQLVYQATR